MTGVAAVIRVVDDDASFRTAIARLLEALGYQVALFASAAQLLEERLTDEPGCILLDVQMEGLNGIELQNVLAELGNILPIVFLTGHGNIPMSVRAVKAGAEDFLCKPVPKEILTDAIRRALARYDEARERRDRLAALRARLAGLTPREREVFALVVRGKLNKQIAFELGTSERTIKAHRRAVMEKFQVQSLAELVSLAERLDLVARPDGSIAA
ncbi:two component transcriptional regulator, LuxR family [Rhizobiales bacterium GAS113]|nr:two component transcriptional regulator, LuxR family [Rhizobiales bacterium GAS113]